MSLILRLMILITTALTLWGDCCGCITLTGQVLADRLVESNTNAIGTIVQQLRAARIRKEDEIRFARIHVESVTGWDTPIPFRIPDEFVVYYCSNQRFSRPYPVGLAVGQRRRFACDRCYIAGRTDVLIALRIVP